MGCFGDESDAPLLAGGGGRNSSRLKFWFYIVSLLLVVTCTLFIIFTILYVREKDKENHPPAPPAPPASDYDHSNDFPLGKLAPWNISQPATRSLSFVTPNVTWANIDVSPVSDQIIFDVLGDIYTLSTAGGEAQILRKGSAFETQARYSPDGSKIVFTSDLSGSDNIWIADLTTQQQTQVTFESYHFVSNAFWINQTHIVAVKWYTSTRSIGAGEIWVYNITAPVPGSNPGTKIVGRSSLSSQVGPEEPFPYHDVATGETFIYYSQNVADGNTWNYNKDPHNVIYAIRRVSLRSGRTTTIASGPGGSARPVVSHSGKTLVYVKRTLYLTSLIIHDIESGNEEILFDNLDFDQQESSAPAGVYPGFGFTPKDDAVFVWAQGQIYKIDIATGDETLLPLSVQVNIDISPTVRFSHPIADAPTFQTKIAQYPGVSGNNQLFTYTSLAATYLYQNGTKWSLDANPTSYQFYPTISKDGSLLAHVLWDDLQFATIEVVELNNTSRRYNVPTIGPGRYIRPQFSPSGDSLIYIRLSGDTLSGSTYELHPGVYRNTLRVENGTVTFGPAEFVTQSGFSASFTQNGNSIIAQAGSYPISVSEVSVETGKVGQSVTSLATSLYSTEIAVSPNKAHVAFIEFKKVYIADYATGVRGGPMNVTAISPAGSVSSAAPVSVEGGSYLTWSYDSSKVYWVWGAVLYEFAVPANLQACSAQCLANAVTTHDVSVTANTEVVPETQVVVFDNVTIITMETGVDTIPDGRIVVQGQSILNLGARDSVPIPDGATLIDVAGGYVLPGFIDAHAHWNGAWDYGYKVKADWEMYVNLAFGVTTLHNPSADTLSIFADAELIRAGKKVGPRVFSTGQIIYGAGGPEHCDILSLQDATDYLSALKAVGAWSVKSYNQPTRAARQMILQAARNLELNVVPEGGMAYFWNLNQIIDGHTTIEHSIPMAPLYNDVITLFAESGTAWTPTFIVNYGGIFGERYWFQHTKVWDDQRLLQYVPKDIVEPATVRYVGAQEIDYHHFATSRAVAAVHKQGGLVNAGAHGEMQGIGIHWEIQMFNQSGLLTPYEVLQAATINPAKSLGLDTEIGSLKIGKLADLIFYNATHNPLELQNTPNVMWVMKSGHLYSAPSLDQILPTVQPRASLPPLNLQNVWDN